ncbi:MAG: antibiotic biosynthesis monooxygenase [Pseudomonadota bacterium]
MPITSRPRLSPAKAKKFARLGAVPYYIVAFSSQKSPRQQGYRQMSEKMFHLAMEEFGCLGVETARDARGFQITNSYWQSLADIRRWKNDPRHQQAQALGKTRWYDHYEIRIGKITRAYPLS